MTAKATCRNPLWEISQGKSRFGKVKWLNGGGLNAENLLPRRQRPMVRCRYEAVPGWRRQRLGRYLSRSCCSLTMSLCTSLTLRS